MAFRRTFAGMAADGLMDIVQRDCAPPVVALERERALWFQVTGGALAPRSGLWALLVPAGVVLRHQSPGRRGARP